MNEINKLIKLDYKISIGCALLGLIVNIIYFIIFGKIIWNFEISFNFITGILLGIVIYSIFIDSKLKKVKIEQMLGDINE